MTVRDKKNIYELYYYHNYIPASIARLYGLSHQRILQILDIGQPSMIVPSYECILCSNENALPYFIDGNEQNNKPQNIVVLCEMDKRRIQRLQIRRGKEIVNNPL